MWIMGWCIGGGRFGCSWGWCGWCIFGCFGSGFGCFVFGFGMFFGVDFFLMFVGDFFVVCMVFFGQCVLFVQIVLVGFFQFVQDVGVFFIWCYCFVIVVFGVGVFLVYFNIDGGFVVVGVDGYFL